MKKLLIIFSILGFSSLVFGCAETSITDSQEVYKSETLGFSMEIPEGYYVWEGNGTSMSVLRNRISDNDTPLPEFNFRIGELGEFSDSVENHDFFISKEDFEANGVTGIKYISSYGEIYPGAKCDSYVFENKENEFYFHPYECLNSDVYVDVVKSFMLI